MRTGWIVAGVMVLTLAATGRSEDDGFRNSEGETPLQVALRQNEPQEVMRLLTETQAAYFETFTLGDPPNATPLPSARLDRAAAVLLGLVRQHPASPPVNFVFGMLSVKRNDLARAELAFERVLQAAPDNHRAGLELARVCTLTGQHAAARRHYEHVLAQNPPPNVVKNIEGQLSEIERLTKRFHLSGRFDLGYIADDNVNVGPDSDTVGVSPISVGTTIFTELSVAPSSQPVDSEGAYVAATLDALFDTGLPGVWGIMSTLNYYETALDVSEEDTRMLRASLGLKRAGRRDLFQTALRVGRIWTGSEQLVDTLGIAPAYLRSFKGAVPLHWISTALVEHHEYDTRNTRDGLYTAVEQRLRAALTEQAALFVGLRAAHNSADDDAFTYTGLSAIAGTAYAWERVQLAASARHTRNDHEAREVLAPEDRVDNQWLLNARASLRLTDHTGIEIKQQYTDNESTFDLYDYTRNVTMISLWGRF